MSNKDIWYNNEAVLPNSWTTMLQCNSLTGTTGPTDFTQIAKGISIKVSNFPYLFGTTLSEIDDAIIVTGSLINTTLQSLAGIEVQRTLAWELDRVVTHIANNSHDLEPEFRKVIEDKFWDMI